VKARTAVLDFAVKLEKDYGIILPHLSHSAPIQAEEAVTESPAKTPVTPTSLTKNEKTEEVSAWDLDIKTLLSGDWVTTTLPNVLKNAGKFIGSSVGGFLGVFGFLLSFIIVPLYLYYFLIESAKIKQHRLPIIPREPG
jgi:predicted PurR-regulated permease PerM